MMYSWLVYKQQAPKAHLVCSAKQANATKIVHNVMSIQDLVPLLGKVLLLIAEPKSTNNGWINPSTSQ